MSEEELSVSVRWKRPARRAIPILVGALSVGVSTLRLLEPRDRDAHATPVWSASEWSCTADELERSFGMTDERIAETRGNGENGRNTSREGNGFLLEKELTRQAIRAFYRVYNRLGYGRLEPVYENALAIELTKMGIPFERQKRIEVWYDQEVIGVYRADLVIDGKVIVEIKAGRTLDESARAQLLDYLTCSDIQVGLLLHFGPTPKFHRVVNTRNIGREPYPR